MNEEQEASPAPRSPEPCEAANTLRFLPREKPLEEIFEEGRLYGLRTPWPIFTGPIWNPRVTKLDEAAPEDLPDAADAILLAHSARMAIRAAAKVEQAWGKWDGSDINRDTVPLCHTMKELLEQRDRAAAFFFKVRETQARIQHLGSICDRGKVPSLPKPRMPRARKKSAAG